MATDQSPIRPPSAPEGYNDLRYEEDNGLFEMFLTYKKRLNRWRYFKRALLITVITTIALFAVVMATISPNEGAPIVTMSVSDEDLKLSTAGSFLFIIVLVAFAVPHYMLMIRRLHDLNKTGWLTLITLIPAINTLFALYLLFAPGTVGANDYGADPVEGVG